MQNRTFRLLTSLFALGFLACHGFAQSSAGVIKAMRVTGTVSRVASGGTQTPLTDGTALTETDTVVTGANSSLVLVFMNGSSVRLGANSRLLIEEFKMDPLDHDIAVAQLKNEPTHSKTSLNLSYGELVGDVKKLNKSSSYSIKTAVGAAGIRGTTFRIVFTPSADGKTYNFQLSTAEGLVVFTGTAGSMPIEVAKGKEVVVTAEVNTTTGQVTASQVQIQGLSSESAQQIQAAVTDAIEQAQQNAVFTPTEQTATSGGGDAAGAPSSNSTPDPLGQAAPTITQPISPTVVSPSS